MAQIRLPNTLRPLTAGQAEVLVAADELGAALTALEAMHPGFEERLLTDDRRLRGFVNVFVGDTECRQLGGLSTPVDDQTVITIVPAVAGG
ncbi:MAG: MoaD/ThiS family protein [Actinomycetota bacterium]